MTSKSPIDIRYDRQQGSRVDILSVAVDPVTFNDALSRCVEFVESGDGQHVVVTPNPEMILEVIHEGTFHARRKSGEATLWNILNKADLVVPDGVGLLLADKILGKQFNEHHLVERVSGVDLLEQLCERGAKRGWKVLLLGGAPGVSEAAARVLEERNEGLDIVSVQESGSGDEKDDVRLREEILRVKPDVVFVAFGMGKQERWIHRNLEHLPSVKLAMGVGGAFDFLAGSRSMNAGRQLGKTRRAPKAFQRYWFEWLWRVIFAPWRWRRVFNAVFVFLWWVLITRIRQRPVYRENVLVCLYREGEMGKEVLIATREDDYSHWQMVQGGIEEGESIEYAAYEEIKEEVGLADRSMLSAERELPVRYRYRWPFDIRWRQYDAKYLGQEQRLLLVQYFGDPDAVDLRSRYATDDLFHEYRWVPADQFLESLNPVRREAASYFLSVLQ